MRRRVAILFGAGASYGPDNAYPERPPLGDELLDRLCKHYPDSWGRPEVTAAFTSAADMPKFEVGMGVLVQNKVEVLQRLWVDFGDYFRRFRVRDLDGDPHSGLAKLVKKLDLVGSTVFCSLNYECLLEWCLVGTFRDLTYVLRQEHLYELAAAPKVLKLHGSCNFVDSLDGISFNTVHVAGCGLGFVGGGSVRVLQPQELEKSYETLGLSFGPVLSAYAPGKPGMVSPEILDQLRLAWTHWIGTVQLVVVIGANPYLSDRHVWDPILNSGAKIVYVGPTTRQWQHLEADYPARVAQIAKKFETSMNAIEGSLREWSRG